MTAIVHSKSLWLMPKNVFFFIEEDQGLILRLQFHQLVFTVYDTDWMPLSLPHNYALLAAGDQNTSLDISLKKTGQIIVRYFPRPLCVDGKVGIFPLDDLHEAYPQRPFPQPIDMYITPECASNRMPENIYLTFPLDRVAYGKNPQISPLYINRHGIVRYVSCPDKNIEIIWFRHHSERESHVNPYIVGEGTPPYGFDAIRFLPGNYALLNGELAAPVSRYFLTFFPRKNPIQQFWVKHPNRSGERCTLEAIWYKRKDEFSYVTIVHRHIAIENGQMKTYASEIGYSQDAVDLDMMIDSYPIKTEEGYEFVIEIDGSEPIRVPFLNPFAINPLSEPLNDPLPEKRRPPHKTETSIETDDATRKRLANLWLDYDTRHDKNNQSRSSS